MALKEEKVRVASGKKKASVPCKRDTMSLCTQTLTLENEGSQGCGRKILRSRARRQHPGEEQDTSSTLGRASQRSDPSTCGGSVLQWPVLASLKVCGRSRSGRASGPTWIRWIVCVHAQHPWNGTCQGSMGRMAGSCSS